MGVYKPLFKRAIFPISEYIAGTSIQTKLKFLHRSQRWSREELEEYQNKRIRLLIKHAYGNVPYYRTLFKKHHILPSEIKNKNDLKKIPILTKEDLKTNCELLRAVNLRGCSFPTYSSGSTGQPKKFFITKESQSWGWAATYRAWSWQGYQLGDKYTKLSLNKRDSMKKKIQDFLFRTQYSYTYNLNNKIIEELVKKLNKFKPHYIRSYPSSLAILSKHIKENKINIHKPKCIFTTGENLLKSDLDLIMKVFGSDCFDAYGGDTCTIAFETPNHNGYYVADELVALNFERTKKGNEIIVTNLVNYAFPLIRYNIEDIAEPCKSDVRDQFSFSKIKNIDGRSSEVVALPDGGKLVVHYFTILFEYYKGIDHFQIMQDKINNLIINLVINKEYKKEDEKRIIKQIKKDTNNKVKINIHYIRRIKETLSGKRRIIISEI